MRKGAGSQADPSASGGKCHLPRGEDEAGDGHLNVSVEKDGEERVRLEVRDDGKGMPEEKAEELERLLNEPSRPEENQSFGLFLYQGAASNPLWRPVLRPGEKRGK